MITRKTRKERQRTAYRLAGASAEDARLHWDIVLKAPGHAVGAYTILAIVWIGDRPHWRCAVTLRTPDGRTIHPGSASTGVQKIGHAVASALLKGVGSVPEVHHIKSFSFVGTKPLSDSEKANLKPVKTRHVVQFDETPERDRTLVDLPEE